MNWKISRIFNGKAACIIRKDTATKIKRIQAELLDNYKATHIGYSGGKDSNLLLQLAVEMLLVLPPSNRARDVHIAGNDILVESPLISGYIYTILTKLEAAVKGLNLPIKIRKTTPELDQIFWVNIIGRSYLPPNRNFRWWADKKPGHWKAHLS